MDNEFQELIDNTDSTNPMDVASLLAIYNKSKYNKLKLCEELSELSEVILKSINKIPEKQPSIEQIIEEAGDVIFRLMVFSEMLGIENQITARVEQKAYKLYSYIIQGKYKGGV